MTTTTYRVHLAARDHGRLELREGSEPATPPKPPERTPARVARLVALAHRIERMVCTGEFRDYAQVALAAGITRARASQLVDLTLLAPDIQERLLVMQRVEGEPEPLGEQDLRPVVREPDWDKQRTVFNRLSASPRASGSLTA